MTQEQRYAITDLGKTYVTLTNCGGGRDLVWAYVARNLSRPLAFSAGGGWANIVVGNPPWVAFRNMSADLQKRFKELAQGERVYVGGKLATQNDLCTLFTARASAHYLRSAGRLAFVLPMAALTRGQFEKLRTGSFHSGKIQWDETWTMDDGVQPLFPVPSCVVFGRRAQHQRRCQTRCELFPASCRSAMLMRMSPICVEGNPRCAEASRSDFHGRLGLPQRFSAGRYLGPARIVFRRSQADGTARVGSLSARGRKSPKLPGKAALEELGWDRWSCRNRVSSPGTAW